MPNDRRRTYTIRHCRTILMDFNTYGLVWLVKVMVSHCSFRLFLFLRRTKPNFCFFYYLGGGVSIMLFGKLYVSTPNAYRFIGAGVE